MADYLPALQLRDKWYGIQTNPHPGDLVLIRDESVTNPWPEGLGQKLLLKNVFQMAMDLFGEFECGHLRWC